MDPLAVICVYLIAVSPIAVGVTVYDKRAAKLHSTCRVPEITLFSLAAVGGSVAMFLTMLIIRHKTRHLRFMLGLPVIIVLQSLIVLALSAF